MSVERATQLSSEAPIPGPPLPQAAAAKLRKADPAVITTLSVADFWAGRFIAFVMIQPVNQVHANRAIP